VPKLNVQVFGRGGSRRAAEQAAASLALEAAQKALAKTPGARKPRQRSAQLKLAGIATPQGEVSASGTPHAAQPGTEKA